MFLLALIAEDKTKYAEIKKKYSLDEASSMQSEAQHFNEIGLFADISEESLSDGIQSQKINSNHALPFKIGSIPSLRSNLQSHHGSFKFLHSEDHPNRKLQSTRSNLLNFVPSLG